MFRRLIIIAVLCTVTAVGPTMSWAEDVSILTVPEGIVQPAEQPFASTAFGNSGGTDEKSAGRAVLYSALVPGWGHYYLGEKGKAYTFFAIEALVWTSFISFKVQADLRKDGYEAYAQTFAGITRTGHSDDFYSILTRYDSALQYEEHIKDEGRFDLYPNIDAASLNQYFEQERVSDYEPWTWVSAEYRRAYQDRRAASKRADRRALYAASAALANRVAAVFFTVLSARSEAAADEAVPLGDSGSHLQLEFRGSDTLESNVMFTHRF